MYLWEFQKVAAECDERLGQAMKKLHNQTEIEEYLLSPAVTTEDVNYLAQDFLDYCGCLYNSIDWQVNGSYHKKRILQDLFDKVSLEIPQVKTKAVPKKEVPKQVTPQPIGRYLSRQEISERYAKFKNKLQQLQLGDMDITNGQITEDQPVTALDGFYLDAKGYADELDCSGLALLNQQEEFMATGHLEMGTDQHLHLVLAAEDIDYQMLQKNNQYNLLLFGKETAYLLPCKVFFNPLERAERALCLDFGTSNTTAGSYGLLPGDDPDQLEFVPFLDKRGAEPRQQKMVPTIVYVQKIDEQGPHFLYGYEAQARVEAQDYNTTASVFYELKRWISHLDEEETIYDEEGNRTKISRRTILKSYIRFVIRQAEQYFAVKFQQLHFTAPVKLKGAFIDQIKNLFDGEYEVLSAERSLDEGMAIVYKYISRQVEAGKIKEGKAGHPIMISDCGGGTTDLARCEYMLLPSSTDTPVLQITTAFENGDPNFGGNNLTYRILQMLKVKMHHYHQTQQDISMKEMFITENEMLDVIDREKEDGYKRIYQKFEQAYADAEDFIPTRFAEEMMIAKSQKLRRNYYYLWKMAEDYKKSFYKAQTDIVDLDLDDPEDREIGCGNETMYYLYERDGQGNLQKVDNPLKGLHITIKDVERLFYADIYNLWVRVLPMDELAQTNFRFDYKLAGQSCKINLFAQLLKEFIPGRYLRSGDKVKQNQSNESQLKLDCLEGALRYIRDTDDGIIEPHIEAALPNWQYTIQLTKKKRNLLTKGEDGKLQVEVGFFPRTTKHVQISILKHYENEEDKNMGEKANDVAFKLESGTNGKEIHIADLTNRIEAYTYPQYNYLGDAVGIKLGAVDKAGFVIFAIPAKTGNGIYLFQVDKRLDGGNAKYYLQKEPEEFDFETSELTNFFDGKR